MLDIFVPYILAGVALGAVPSARPDSHAAGRRNILLIVLDDVGTDQLQVYGETPLGSYASTPCIDSLARKGILFRNFYVNPLCSTTRACMQTGRYAFRHGVGDVTDQPLGSTYELASSEVLLAELLRNGFPAGSSYRCGFFGKWHLGQAGKPGHAVENGYHRFRGMLGNTANHFLWTKIEHDAGGALAEFQETAWNASVARADAVQWINAQPSPYFACVSFNQPHMPTQVPPYELLSEPTRLVLEKLDPLPTAIPPQPPRPGDPGHRVLGTNPLVKLYYRVMLEAVDREIANLLDGIHPNKLSDTTVFLVSDNGTPRFALSKPHDREHGKGTTYQYGVRVPMIVTGSPVPPVPEDHPTEGWETAACVGAVDLWRTFAALSGADEVLAFQTLGFDDPPCIDSIGFAELLADPTGPGARALAFSQVFKPNVAPSPCLTQCLPDLCLNDCRAPHSRALTDGNYKYILKKPESSQPCAPFFYEKELYQVSLDPDERFNRLIGYPDNLEGDTPESDAAYRLLSAEMAALSGF